MNLGASQGYVALSFVTAALATYASINFASWHHPRRWVRHTARGTLLGFGVWAMHFIGMLVTEGGSGVRYDVVLTGISALAAIVMMTLAMAHLDRPAVRTSTLAWAAALSAFGIVFMHFLGIHAMNVGLHGEWHLVPLVASVTIAYLASFLGLSLIGHAVSSRAARLAPGERRGVKAAASATLALAISGMHFTGMLAYTVHRHTPTPGGASGQDVALVVLGVVLILCMASEVLLADQRAQTE